MNFGTSKQKIKDIYKLGKTIGRGSYAKVKQAKNRETGQKVAVKIFNKLKMSDDDIIQLQTEIEILKQIDHPNIVKLFEVYEEQEHWCLVMELMEGGDLLSLIQENKKFSEKKVRDATKLLVDAINYCHSMEILHRDIKLENLLIQQKELDLATLKIADFGLAKIVKSQSFATTQCGSPNYVAPEILRKQNYGKECDYWSIGIVVFILLSGECPFYDQDNPINLFHKIMDCKYEFKENSWTGISAEAQDFISKLLVTDPKKRMNYEQILSHSWINQEIRN